MIAQRRKSKKFRRKVVTALFLGDFICSLLGISMGYFLRFETFIQSIGFTTQTMPSFSNYLSLIFVGGILLSLTFIYFDVYNWKYALRPRKTLPKLAKGITFWFFLFLTVSLVFKLEPSISRMFVACSWVSTILIFLLWRFCVFKFLSLDRFSEYLTQRVVIVGWNADAEKLGEAIERNQNHPFSVVGVVLSNDISPEERKRLEHLYLVLGNLNELDTILHWQECDIVINADMNLSRKEIYHLNETCNRELVDFKITPTMFKLFVSSLNLETLSGMPILGVETLSINRTLNRILKRSVDVAGALFGLFISIPIIIVFGIIIKRQDPSGGIFFKQVRTGKGGHPFYIYKLRSMRSDAEKMTGAVWAVKDDTRRLPIGRFLRSWNIDEVPQFWNVLKGELSLVGPRPERPELIEKFKHEIENYNPRHYAKPGITGWAQVNGLRGNTSLSERIRYDLYYIENWSLFFDFQIMLMTFFKRENAY